MINYDVVVRITVRSVAKRSDIHRSAAAWERR
jgi:hypothetical protein